MHLSNDDRTVALIGGGSDRPAATVSIVRFLLSELAAACDGRLIDHGHGPVAVEGVSIDSRSVANGQLFVPLVAERDGHEFIPAAATNGAAAHLTSRSEPEASVRSDNPGIVVADTAAALTAIGRLARSRLDGAVIGITGSVGKTSVKDLTRAACGAGRSVWASAASFNNELGVPLTLANAPDGTEICIVEMGARGIGHIAKLCRTAMPTVGVVTCVALAHSELFGSLEAVAIAKGELVEALPQSGTAVLNADDPLVLGMAARTEAAVLTYGGASAPGAGTGPTARPDVMAGDIRLDRTLRPTFTVASDWGTAELTLQVRGAHMALNAAGAVAAALAAGVGFDDALQGLEGAALSPWRMDVRQAPNGLVVINDAYNANPTSMRAALGSLSALDAKRRVAVFGVMAELGEEGPSEHRAVAEEATAAGVRVIAVDSPAYGAAADHVADLHQAFELLQDLGPGDAVLVKGSRVAGLESLAARLLADA